MTCIVGIVEAGNVYIGADSAAMSGYDVRTSGVPKAFVNGKFAIGYTTSFRMGQILHHQLRVSPQGRESEMEYMVRTFAEAVRSCLKTHGFSSIENNVEEGGSFLVGYKGSLYEVGSDFQINTYPDGVAAIGCGHAYALGALKALENVPVKSRLVQALEITEYYSGGVRGPFSIVKAPTGQGNRKEVR